jgi:hypothetical protein
VLLIYFGLSGGNFIPGPLELLGYPNVNAVSTGDFNKDGKMDIAIAYFDDDTQNGSHLQVFIGNGLGGFAPGQNVVINPQCNNIEVTDLNKDGNLDLVLAGAGSDNTAGLFISSYLGDGAGNFTLKQAIDVGEGAIRGLISLGDFNEDGNVDIAYPMSSDASQGRGNFSTQLLIYLGDGTGKFTQGQTATVGKEPGSAWTADFNKDGHMDIACTNRTDTTLSILFGKGDATFTTHATIPLNVIPAQ